MTPTAARWLAASRALTEARIAHQSAAQQERAAWAALMTEVQDAGTGDTLDDVSVCGNRGAGVPGGAGVRGVADDAGSKGGAA